MGLYCGWRWSTASSPLLLLLLFRHAAEAKPTYSVVAPRVLRPNLPYSVAVSTSDTFGATRVTVQVGGRADSGRFELLTKDTLVQPGGTSTIQFDVGDIGPGQYNLTAAGQGGLSFQSTTELDFVDKSFSVFIQTDKAVYRPGDEVNFRVVVLTPSLRPYTAGTVDVSLKDGKGNQIQQWAQQSTNSGVITKTVQLSDQPVLGDWTLQVDVMGQKTSKMFEVAEYVLPRFEVTIDLPPYAIFSDGSVTATVHAKYDYGLPVRGEVMVRAHPEIKSTTIQPFFRDPVRKTSDIDGKADVTFDLREDLGLTDKDYERELVFDVLVTEALTGRPQNASASTTLHRHKYKLELVKTAQYYKPGLKYTAFLKVATQDDMPAGGGSEMVTVRHGFSNKHEEFTSKDYSIPSNGLVELVFYPPADNTTTVLGIEAEYRGVNQWFSTVPRAMSPSDTFLQAELVTQRPRVDGEVVIRLTASIPFYQFTYQVLGMGRLQLAQTLNAAGANEHDFRFQVRREMVPHARVLVYFVLVDGEVVADALDFDIAESLQNSVEIEAARSASPGGQVDVRIRTRPDSYLCIMGVDQQVMILKSGNDITAADVYAEMESYDPGRLPEGLPHLERRQRSLVFWPGSGTAQQVFQDSGVVVLSNADIFFDPSTDTETGDTVELGKRPDSRPIRPLVYRNDSSTLRPDIGPSIQYTPKERPPLAGPYAFFTIPPPFYHHRRVNVLRDPPKTWLFKDIPTSGTSGETRLRETAPATMNSWVLTAFSVNNLYGLGVSLQPSKMRIFRPFFVKLNLPYAVKRGEVVGIQCIVFNYQDRNVVADVTLEHQGDLQFTTFSEEDSNEVEPTSAPATLELFMEKQVVVPAGDVASVTFMAIPRTLGQIELKVSARTSLAGDTVTRNLLVKPEGVPQVENMAMLVDLGSSQPFNQTVNITLPRSYVNGSNNVHVSAVGDILGGSVGNLEKLLQLPQGCGEQNLLRFVPNVVVLDALTRTGQATASLLRRAVANLRTGYQRQLSYRRQDGSFSAFGDQDQSGSVWLTAFVMRSFSQASKYIEIDDQVMELGLKFLADNQAADGAFNEVGQVSYQPMQGVPLTVFTLLAFMDSQQSARFSENVNRAVSYLVQRLPDDAYGLAVVTYALTRASHPAARGALARLDNLAQEEDDLRWWEEPLTSLKNTSYWYGRPRPQDIEMTSYALLTYLERGRQAEAMPILRWLLRQRNVLGGFQSSQDTVVGVSALAAASTALRSQNSDVTVRLSFGPRDKTLRVTGADALTVQQYQLPDPSVESVQVTASGSGLALVQVTHSYNVEVTAPDPSFYLDPKLDALSNSRHIKVSACVGWEGEGEASNMAVMEIELPSGFTVDEASIPGLYKYRSVKRVETTEGDTKVIIYFDEITTFETCPTVLGYYTSKVARQKRSAVIVYDYYDNTRMARQFYGAIPASLCDICEGSECDPERCKDVRDPARQGSDSDADPDAASAPGAGAAVLVVSTVLTLLLPTLHR